MTSYFACIAIEYPGTTVFGRCFGYPGCLNIAVIRLSNPKAHVSFLMSLIILVALGGKPLRTFSKNLMSSSLSRKTTRGFSMHAKTVIRFQYRELVNIVDRSPF